MTALHKPLVLPTARAALTVRLLAGLALLSALSLGAYLFASQQAYRLGFPLDDAWIHQTYARNLALRGEWAFIPGQPSAGSTAPLWSALLAVGYWLGSGPHAWTYALGWALLLALSAAGITAFKLLCPAKPGCGAWAGVLLALEWHLVWAAGSGMETLLFALIVLISLVYMMREGVSWLKLGLLVGLSAWVRPDGVTLLGPALLLALLREPDWGARLKASSLLVLGVGCLFVPYLLFNRTLVGAWWPNTFFAKQAEYAAHRQAPIWERLAWEASLPLVGAGTLLLPGFAFLVWKKLRERDWNVLAGAAWFVGYLILYAWRLPVTYQHGRYIIPAMPVFFVWGLAGMAALAQPASTVLWRRVLSKAWIFSTALALVIFWLSGLRAFAQDVAVIESEMVDTARWISANTEPDALVAAHDIGALGYFGDRRLLDLAGLVSPEVIPFIRDEALLARFLDDQEADVLVTFPGWYPALSGQGELLYRSQGTYSPAAGGENMAVYGWK